MLPLLEKYVEKEKVLTPNEPLVLPTSDGESFSFPIHQDEEKHIETLIESKMYKINLEMIQMVQLRSFRNTRPLCNERLDMSPILVTNRNK